MNGRKEQNNQGDTNENKYSFFTIWGFTSGSGGKESAYNVGEPDLVPGSERSSRERNGYPLQCSCLENPTDRSLVNYIQVHGVAKSQT